MIWKEIPSDIYETASNIFNILKEDYVQLDYEYYTWNEEDVTEEEYNKAYKYAKIAYDNYEEYNYDGYLELSDNYTLWDIDVSISETQYSDVLEDYIRAFEEEAGTNVWLLGRSGRHVCVDAHIDQCYNFDYLQEIQQRLEQEMIDYINTNYAVQELEEALQVREPEEEACGKKKSKKKVKKESADTDWYTTFLVYDKNENVINEFDTKQEAIDFAENNRDTVYYVLEVEWLDEYDAYDCVTDYDSEVIGIVWDNGNLDESCGKKKSKKKVKKESVPEADNL